MEEDKTEQMREYLRIKKLQEDDKSDEIIEEVYKEVTTNEDTEIDER